MEAVPYSVFEACVRVAGEALHFHWSLQQIMRSCGVSETGVKRYDGASKYIVFRSVWADLDRAGGRGRKVQHNLVQALANLDRPEQRAPDQRAGQKAIEDLRRLATQAELLVAPEQAERDRRRAAAKQEAQNQAAGRMRLDSLRQKFLDLHSETDKQRRGYEFERLLAGIFQTAELEFQGAYKTETDQVDGAVVIDSFTYLLEARWRNAMATDSDIGDLDRKVQRRLDATRGLFVSMAGFRDEAVALYRRAKDQRIVMVDGADLAWILEGRIEVRDAFREKIKAASVYGEPFLRLTTLT